jgi:hypothetical protein
MSSGEHSDTPKPIVTDNEFVDIVLLLGQWRPVSLLPKGDIANGVLVMNASRSSTQEISAALEAAPDGPLHYAAHGTADELGDYLEWNGGGVRLVSTRFRDLLQRLGQCDVQFFPAVIETGRTIDSAIRYGGGPSVTDFWWMHHWRRHDLVDVGRSKVVYRRHIPPIPVEKANIDVERSESLALRVPPDGEALYGLKRWPRYRIATPLLAAGIRKAALRVSLMPRGLTPEAKAKLSTGLHLKLHYLPEAQGFPMPQGANGLDSTSFSGDGPTISYVGSQIHHVIPWSIGWSSGALTLGA